MGHPAEAFSTFHQVPRPLLLLWQVLLECPSSLALNYSSFRCWNNAPEILAKLEARVIPLALQVRMDLLNKRAARRQLESGVEVRDSAGIMTRHLAEQIF